MISDFDNFICDLRYSLESEYSVASCTQNEVKEMIEKYDIENDFSMISFEESNDTYFKADTDSSLFLNSLDYDYDWLYLYEGCDIDNPIALICLHDNYDTIIIDALEVNKKYRHQGIASRIVGIIESCASETYDRVLLTPFDTDADEFWKHLNYEENGQFYTKDI